MLSKLYVGNLPTDITEGALRQLFSDHGVSTTNVLLKRGGYAFVDCLDQAALDKAIEELNGTFLVCHTCLKRAPKQLKQDFCKACNHLHIACTS